MGEAEGRGGFTPFGGLRNDRDVKHDPRAPPEEGATEAPAYGYRRANPRQGGAMTESPETPLSDPVHSESPSEPEAPTAPDEGGGDEGGGDEGGGDAGGDE